MTVTIIPLLSARCKSTGLFRIARDSNISQLTTYYWHALQAGVMRFALPEEHSIHPDCLREFREYFPELYENALRLKYIGGPPHQRRNFWSDNAKRVAGLDVISCQGCHEQELPDIKLINYHAHVGTQQGLAQPIDELMQGEYNMYNIANKVLLNDDGQYKWLLDANGYVPDNVSLLPHIMQLQSGYFGRFGLEKPSWADELSPFVICPGRMSDPEYGWARLAPRVLAEPDTTFVFTDTNGYLSTIGHLPANVHLQSCNRAELYWCLRYAADVLYEPHPQVFHVLKLELDYFRPKH